MNILPIVVKREGYYFVFCGQRLVAEERGCKGRIPTLAGLHLYIYGRIIETLSLMKPFNESTDVDGETLEFTFYYAHTIQGEKILCYFNPVQHGVHILI